MTEKVKERLEEALSQCAKLSGQFIQARCTYPDSICVYEADSTAFELSETLFDLEEALKESDND